MSRKRILSSVLCILVSSTYLVSGQPQGGNKDPCTPNPCGENTRCYSAPVRGDPVISCECLIGYEVPAGADPFDGCVELGGTAANNRGSSRPQSPMRDDLASNVPVVIAEGAPLEALPDPRPAARPVQPVTASPVRPLATTQAPRAVASFNQESRLQEGKRPSFLPPRGDSGGIVRPNEIVDVDTPDLFPEECLVHEDCETNEYCTPPPENKCIDACTLDVCGTGALCLTRIHRPLCVCPDGFDGNPYDKCEETPSRVGMVFKK